MLWTTPETSFFPCSHTVVTKFSLCAFSVLVFRTYTGKMNSSRLFRSGPRDSRYLVLFIPGNENAGGSAICIHKDLLPGDAVVTHMITCQGRDHIVSFQSGRQSLVIVNVHFELELTLRQLRERLTLIAPHWPSYPSSVGIIMGDFNICDPEEGRLNVCNQTFTDGDPRKTAMFHLFSTCP